MYNPNVNNTYEYQQLKPGVAVYRKSFRPLEWSLTHEREGQHTDCYMKIIVDEVRPCAENLRTPLVRRALQHSVPGTECSASDMPWLQVLCAPYPKQGGKLAEPTDGPTARFE